MFPRAAIGLVLAALALAPSALGDPGYYSTPLNAGFDNPITPDQSAEIDPIDFRFRGAAATRFRVDVHDKLGGPTWIHVCVIYQNMCIGNVWGNDSITVNAVPGTYWPDGTIARVWVWTARVYPTGEASIGTWGGLRAQWNNGAQIDDIVPYVASGRGGAPTMLAVPPEACGGSLAGAPCMTLARSVTALRVEVHDDVSERSVFDVCVKNGTTVLRCAGAGDDVVLYGPFPAGATVDIRPYAVSSATVVGTKGYAYIRYLG